MSLTTVTRRSIIDAAEVLDTPLKPVTIKSFKRSNRKIMSKAIVLVIFILLQETKNSNLFDKSCTQELNRTPNIIFNIGKVDLDKS